MRWARASDVDGKNGDPPWLDIAAGPNGDVLLTGTLRTHCASIDFGDGAIFGPCKGSSGSYPSGAKMPEYIALLDTSGGTVQSRTLDDETSGVETPSARSTAPAESTFAERP